MANDARIGREHSAVMADQTTLTPGWNPQSPLGNLTGTAVPGTPAAAADAATAPAMQAISNIMQAALMQSMRPRIAAGQPVVPGGPQPMSQTPPAYMTQSRAWGPERFMYGLQATIQNLGVQKQQRDVAKATNQYSNLLTALDKYVTADGQIDPKAYQDPAVMSILGDPKELKNINKALQVDWLDPKKTTVYGDALKAAITQNQNKQKARTGLYKLFHSLVNRPQAAPLTDQQRQQMAQQIGAKAPITPFGMDTTQDPMKAMNIMSEIDNRLLKRSAVTWGPDGNAYVYNPYDTKQPAQPLVIQRPDGTFGQATGRPGAKANQIIYDPKSKRPMGVYGPDGRTQYVKGTKEYDDYVAAQPEVGPRLDAADATYRQGLNEALTQKIPEEVLAVNGPPPTPPIGPDGKLNYKDPGYLQQYKTWGEGVMAAKAKEAGERGESVAQARFDWQTAWYSDPNDPGTLKMAPKRVIIQNGWISPQSAAPQAAISYQQFITSGAGGQQITAYNTAIAHSDILEQAATALNNKDYPALNAINNKVRTELGSAAVTNFELVSEAFSQEINKAFAAGNITEGQLNTIKGLLPSDASPEQIMGAISYYRALATSKAQMLYLGWLQGQKGLPNFPPGVQTGSTVGGAAAFAAPGTGAKTVAPPSSAAGPATVTAKTPANEARKPPAENDIRYDQNGKQMKWRSGPGGYGWYYTGQ